jgi:adenine-specific DNA-methyltransferase
MLNLFKDKICELYNIILSPIDNMFKLTALDSYKKENKVAHKKDLGAVYYEFIKNNKEKGTVYTPEPISSYMIENTISAEQIIKNPYIKIVDPSCGTGNILISCFKHLRNLYRNNLATINRQNGLNLSIHGVDEHIIAHNLYGFDIDDIAVKLLVIVLYDISKGSVLRNGFNADFLLHESKQKYDVFIGNPPYVGKKSIDKEYASYLKNRYKEVYSDKGDLSYCFFKKALEDISHQGKLTFITSRYFLESPSGEDLRKVLKSECSIDKIVDFYGIRPFKNVGIDPVIIFITKGEREDNKIEVIKPLSIKSENKKDFYNSVFLKDGNQFNRFFLNKNLLSSKGWILRDEKEREIVNKIKERSFTHLSTVCNSYQGVITGCDKAFVVTNEIIEKENIERDLIKPWIKSSYIEKNEVLRRDNYIIYSSLIKDPQQYPNAIAYIGAHKEKLLKRRECEKGVRKWYELQWGRSQEIFDGGKIILPFKASSNRFVFDKGSYFSADVYALVLKEDAPYTYEFLLYLLNSKIYEFYFKTFAKKLGEDAYEYYPNTLMKLCIPIMRGFEGKDESYLYDYFQFNEEERKIILG